jgi:hypothetical protein
VTNCNSQQLSDLTLISKTNTGRHFLMWLIDVVLALSPFLCTASHSDGQKTRTDWRRWVSKSLQRISFNFQMSLTTISQAATAATSFLAMPTCPKIQNAANVSPLLCKWTVFLTVSTKGQCMLVFLRARTTLSESVNVFAYWSFNSVTWHEECTQLYI